MTRIVLDEELRTKLRGLKERLEFCDETGRVLEAKPTESGADGGFRLAPRGSPTLPALS